RRREVEKPDRTGSVDRDVRVESSGRVGAEHRLRVLERGAAVQRTPEVDAARHPADDGRPTHWRGDVDVVIALVDGDRWLAVAAGRHVLRREAPSGRRR